MHLLHTKCGAYCGQSDACLKNKQKNWKKLLKTNKTTVWASKATDANLKDAKSRSLKREGRVDKEVAKSDTKGTRCSQKIDVTYLKYY